MRSIELLGRKVSSQLERRGACKVASTLAKTIGEVERAQGPIA
jgi:hypothetical protein